MKMKKKNKALTLGNFIVFLLILVSKETLLFGTNANKMFFYIHIAIQVLILVCLLLFTRTMQRSLLLFSVALMILNVLTFIINRDGDYFKFIYSCLLIVLSLFVVTFIKIDEFIEAYSNILYFLACFSIVLFLVAYFVPELVNVFPILTNEEGFHYSFLGFGAVQKTFASALPRMYGIFREPGVFGCLLSFAIVIELFFKEELSIKRTVILSLAAMLTFSTAAYIVLFMLVALYLVNDFLGGRVGKKSTIFLVVFVLIALFLLLEIVIGRFLGFVFDKLFVDNSSRDARFGAISANLRMFFENPIVGKGWSFVQNNYISYAEIGLYESRHNTNTFLKYLSIYGVIAFGVLVTGTYKFFKIASKNMILGWLLMALWVVILSNEDFTLNIMFYILPLYGFSGIDNKNPIDRQGLIV